MMVALAVLISGITSVASAQPVTYKEEVRGVWVTNVASPMLYNKDQIAQAMDYLAANGINVVFPVVWNKAETQYRSQIMKDIFGIEIEPVFAQQGRDPLAELIVEAHRNGMEVIPWFEYGFAASFGDTLNNRILNKFPHWASRDVNGRIAENNGFFWLNGIHHEVQDFMNSLIHEVIDNYDIDGIQGDDRLPAMTSKAGYDPYTVALYRSEHGGADPSIFQYNNAWLLWRSGKLTSYLGRLYHSVKAKDERLIVSMSPSVYNFSWREYLQDGPQWLDSAYVDMIHPQMYRYTVPGYRDLVQAAVGPVPGSIGGYVKPADRHKLSPGIIVRAGNQFVTPQQVREKVAINREFGINGEVYFFYEGMGAANSFLADTLAKYFYDEPAILPFRQGQLRRPRGTIVNETDAGAVRTGSWQAVIPTPAPNGYEGRSLRGNAGSGATITYNIDVPYEAWYRVYAFIPHNTSDPTVATTTAHYTTYFNNGADSVVTVVNQQLFRNRGWIQIANVPLQAGVRPVVRVRTNDITDGKPMFADAVMLLIDRKKSPDVAIPVLTSIDEPSENDLPSGVTLYPAYPNPFNPATTIRYRLDTSQQVRLRVFDLLGRQVALLADGMMPAGEHAVQFEAGQLASGVYIYRLETGSRMLTQKMVLLK